MSALLFHGATEADLPAIIRLLNDDELGKLREDASLPLNQKYIDAFRAMQSDSNNELIVVKLDGEVAGTVQITFIPGLSHQGRWRGQLEAVRIASHLRGRGYGAQLIRHAVDRCKAKGCGIVQFTTDARREHAQRFYERLGFVPSHVGMKLIIN